MAGDWRGNQRQEAAISPVVTVGAIVTGARSIFSIYGRMAEKVFTLCQHRPEFAGRIAGVLVARENPDGDIIHAGIALECLIVCPHAFVFAFNVKAILPRRPAKPDALSGGAHSGTGFLTAR